MKSPFVVDSPTQAGVIIYTQTAGGHAISLQNSHKMAWLRRFCVTVIQEGCTAFSSEFRGRTIIGTCSNNQWLVLNDAGLPESVARPLEAYERRPND
jgi:hypothetical protein